MPRPLPNDLSHDAFQEIWMIPKSLIITVLVCLTLL
jgi:hypothetical protein